MKDRELVERFQNGEKSAFDELVKRHYAETFSLYMRMAGDEMLADDLCQETYLRVYRGLTRFRNESAFSTWLYRISVNVANSHFRKENSERFSSVTQKLNATQREKSRTTSGRMPGSGQAIKKLPKKQRTVVMLRTFQQLPFREVAKIMDITENSAKVNFHHAVSNLRKELEKE
jgi:RNA polymerase sigma-70 factor (ECF subfamily)